MISLNFIHFKKSNFVKESGKYTKRTFVIKCTKLYGCIFFYEVKFYKSIFLIERKDFGNRSFNNKCGNMTKFSFKINTTIRDSYLSDI